MANYHLAILKKPYLERILSGRKPIELRLTRTRRAPFGRIAAGDNGCWQNKKNCRFALLIWMEDVRAIGPVRIDKKDWRAWVVLTDKKHFGLLKLLPQNRPGPDTCA